MSPRAGLVAILLCLGGCASTPAVAERFEDRPGAITVGADRLERSETGDTLVLLFSGKVVVQQAKSILHADRVKVFIDMRHDTIVRSISTGNVRLRAGDCLVVSAERVVYYGPEEQLALGLNASITVKGETVVTREPVLIELATIPWAMRRCAD